MKSLTLSVIFALVILVSVSHQQSIAQDSVKSAHQSEVSAEVPALDGFHDVIYKIWHTAWPEKNVGMLVELLTEVEQLSEPLLKAELPGILRDKKAVWKQNLDELEKAIADYKLAASPVDSQKLLGAAEQLHGKYEKLVRSIRPVLPEMEKFHESLYMLYHYYLPDYDLKMIKKSSKEMAAKMKTLDEAKLPKRYETKEAAFSEARKNLSASVKTLQKTLKSNSKESITADIESLHSNYQALEKVFD
jgi:hypothetical protein